MCSDAETTTDFELSSFSGYDILVCNRHFDFERQKTTIMTREIFVSEDWNHWWKPERIVIAVEGKAFNFESSSVPIVSTYSTETFAWLHSQGKELGYTGEAFAPNIEILWPRIERFEIRAQVSWCSQDGRALIPEKTGTITSGVVSFA